MTEPELRRCGRCSCFKPVAEFDTRSKGGYQGYCRPCHKVYKQENYRQNRDKFVRRALEHKARLQQIVRTAKDCPCKDCGERYPPYVMDFDHREGETKLFNIADRGSRSWMSVADLENEIAKCDVVCANCHRERTHQRRCRKKVESGS